MQISYDAGKKANTHIIIQPVIHTLFKFNLHYIPANVVLLENTFLLFVCFIVFVFFKCSPKRKEFPKNKMEV